MTPKEYKKKSTEIMHTRNRVLVAFATKKIHSRGDMMALLGLNSIDSTALTRESIFEYFAQYQTKLDNEKNGVVICDVVAPSNGTTATNLTISPAPTPIESDEEKLLPHETLPLSHNQKCTLFPFQERSAAQLFHGIVDKHRPAQLLQAPVGVGKTYIIGAVADRLRNINFCEGKTFAPWPMLYVTKATIVEQTQRVLQQQFNIDTVNTLKVINIEQLRASLGELMVRCEVMVHNGEEHFDWKWREGMHPIIFFLDECQILKNEDSQQAQIITAIHKLNHPNIHCIFFSATPFLRVVDCKCFILNARMEMKGMFDN